MPTAKIGGKERTYCADCYWKIEKEYKSKKNCEDCSYFSKDRCKKNAQHLEPVTIGYNTYFVQAEKCSDFSTDKEIALKEIKKLEAQRQFEEAASEYEKLGMTAEAEEAKKKAKQTPEHPIDLNAQIKNLSQKGQTITYYCCHCGAPLKIGAKAPKIQETCPKCNGDLQVINLEKLIKQHSST
jgi:DNA-binding transcriptional MerR regulator